MNDANPAPAARDGSRRAVVLADVARGARLNREFLLLMALSSAIATVGLLQGSTAVVIGAMLVSPLMAPIMALGFGIATIESGLIRRALVTLAAGIAVAIAAAAALIWLSPMRDVTAELQARTQPTLLDLTVAVIGGIAGVYSIIRRLPGVMTGVAIATALVPPLSTIAFGLVTGRLDFAGGAALLFLTNTLAIAFSATLIARLNRFGPSLTPQHTALQVAGIMAVLGVLSVPLALSLDRLVRETRARQAVQAALVDRLGSKARIDTLDVTIADGRVSAEGLVLVDAFDGDLGPAIARAAARSLHRPVDADFVQIRQESASARDTQRRLAERVAQLEAGDAEAAEVLRLVGVGTTLARSTVTIDPQLRQIVIPAPTGNDPTARAAFDATLTAARQAKPDWQFLVLGEKGPQPVTPAPSEAERSAQ